MVPFGKRPCYICNEPGHIGRDCPKNKALTADGGAAAQAQVAVATGGRAYGLCVSNENESPYVRGRLWDDTTNNDNAHPTNDDHPTTNDQRPNDDYEGWPGCVTEAGEDSDGETDSGQQQRQELTDNIEQQQSKSQTTELTSKDIR